MANNSTAQQHQAVAAPGPQLILVCKLLLLVPAVPTVRRVPISASFLLIPLQGVDVLLAGGATNLLVIVAGLLTRGDCLDAQRAPAGVTPVIGVPPAAANPIVAAGPAIPSGSNQPTAAPVINQQVSAPAPHPPGDTPALNQSGTVSTSNTSSVLAASGQFANPSVVHQVIAAPSTNQAPPPTSLIPTATTPIIHPIVAAPIVNAQRPASVASQPLSSVPPAPSILNGIPSTWIPVSNWAYVIPQPRGGTLTIPAPLRVQTS
ncbi:hypothetical protein D6C95_04817 [Aureobasidium pullulans]|nr:hypothetical protein D6C95_04817 [Aureobasidium pullulans]